MSPARSTSPSRPATSRAVCATSGVPHMPMSPAAEHRDGRSGRSAAAASRRHRRWDLRASSSTRGARAADARTATRMTRSSDAHQPLPSFTIRGTVPPLATDADSRPSKAASPIGCSCRRRKRSIAGGPAEELERRIQDVFKAGYEHVVIDLRGVPTADSAGIRALVRGHTSAQRLNRRFTLVSPNPRVMELLELSLLTRVLEVVDTLVEAKTKRFRGIACWTGIAVAVVGLALVGVGVEWPDLGLRRRAARRGADSRRHRLRRRPRSRSTHPLFELAKLVASAVIGMLVTVVHRQYRHERQRQSGARSGAGAAVHLRRADDDHHRQLGGARLRHRRRGQHHPLPHAGRGRARHHDPVHPDGPGHGRRPRRARRRRPRHAVPVRDDSDPQRVQLRAAAHR